MLQNPKDFASLFMPIYGIKLAGQFEELFTQHLMIAGDLVNAVKNGEADKADGIKMRMKLRNFYLPLTRAGVKQNGKICCTVI